MKKNTTHNLTVAAMLSAVAFILMFIEFPLPMLIPSFVKMDFSDLPACWVPLHWAGVRRGHQLYEEPAAHHHQGHLHRLRGRAVQLYAGRGVLRCGGLCLQAPQEPQDRHSGCHRRCSRHGRVQRASNYFITYPAYVQFYHMPLEAILGMYQAILPLPTA